MIPSFSCLHAAAGFSGFGRSGEQHGVVVVEVEEVGDAGGVVGEAALAVGGIHGEIKQTVGFDAVPDAVHIFALALIHVFPAEGELPRI